MKKTLLIVDDEPAIRLILEHYFSPDYQVVLKTNGREALDWLGQGNLAHVIVVDYDMPVLDGPTFLRQVRANADWQQLGVIVLSGKDTTSDKILCLKLGADDYLVKPFNPEELSLRMHNILKRVTI